MSGFGVNEKVGYSVWWSMVSMGGPECVEMETYMALERRVTGVWLDWMVNVTRAVRFFLGVAQRACLRVYRAAPTHPAAFHLAPTVPRAPSRLRLICAWDALCSPEWWTQGRRADGDSRGVLVFLGVVRLPRYCVTWYECASTPSPRPALHLVRNWWECACPYVVRRAPCSCVAGSLSRRPILLDLSVSVRNVLARKVSRTSGEGVASSATVIRGNEVYTGGRSWRGKASVGSAYTPEKSPLWQERVAFKAVRILTLLREPRALYASILTPPTQRSVAAQNRSPTSASRRATATFRKYGRERQRAGVDERRGNGDRRSGRERRRARGKGEEEAVVARPYGMRHSGGSASSAAPNAEQDALRPLLTERANGTDKLLADPRLRPRIRASVGRRERGIAERAGVLVYSELDTRVTRPWGDEEPQKQNPPSPPGLICLYAVFQTSGRESGLRAEASQGAQETVPPRRKGLVGGGWESVSVGARERERRRREETKEGVKRKRQWDETLRMWAGTGVVSGRKALVLDLHPGEHLVLSLWGLDRIDRNVRACARQETLSLERKRLEGMKGDDKRRLRVHDLDQKLSRGRGCSVPARVGWFFPPYVRKTRVAEPLGRYSHAHSGCRGRNPAVHSLVGKIPVAGVEKR
ncbi:hypothetical protein B0H12DRAFT_1303349 [Mycena haematopus]|nr:hypothetical protein B0H12DRAFT_1303349 [Mycena haematopus]